MILQKIDEAGTCYPVRHECLGGETARRFDADRHSACQPGIKRHKTPGAVAWNPRRRQPFYRDRLKLPTAQNISSSIPARRNLGKQVAEYYQQSGECGWTRGYDEYLEETRGAHTHLQRSRADRKEIQEALKQLQWKPDASADAGGSLLSDRKISGSLSARRGDLPAVCTPEPGKNGGNPAGTNRPYRRPMRSTRFITISTQTR